MEISLQCRRLMHKLRLSKTWWIRRHRAYQPLFVVATCRSGSNLLVSQLTQQPGVGMKSELLYPGDYRGIWRYKTSPTAAIRHLRYSLHTLREPVRGCKLMLYQLTNCRLEIEDIQDAFPGARYVILYRQNLAEQYVSQCLADTTRQFVLLPGEERKVTRIKIDPVDLEQYCDDLRAGYRDLLSRSWLAERSVLLSYEELIDRPGYWLRHQICPLIGVEAVTPKVKLLKQNTQPLSATVANYSQVKSLLLNCRQYHQWPEVTRRKVA